MLKSKVPLSFFSVAFIIGLPSAANPGPPAITDSGKSVLYTNSSSNSARSKNVKMSLSLPPTQGMSFVHNYIRNNNEYLESVKERSGAPFAIIDSVLRRYGLPLELKYLAVIESELNPTARSRVGAKGPWQLMPGTAHELGLKVNHRSDERVNFYKSSRAAAKYLRDLHREFGDWLLVLAAYNGGPVPVCRAIHKAHSRNFWMLQKYLPAESRLHVKKFIATAYFFEGAGALQNAGQVKAPALGLPESDNDRFNRLMLESAESLQESNDLLGF